MHRPLRVLEISPDFYPFALGYGARFPRVLAEALSSFGCEVTAIATTPARSLKQKGDSETHPEDRYRLELLMLLPAPSRLSILTYSMPLLPTESLRLVRWLRARLDTFDAVIVQGYNEALPRLFLLLFGKHLRDRLVLINQGLSLATQSRWLRVCSAAYHMTVGRWIGSNIRSVYSSSKSTESEFRKYVGARVNRTYARFELGVDSRQFRSLVTEVLRDPGVSICRVRTVFGIAGPYVYAVGTPSPSKGLDILMRAFKTIASSRENLSLVLSGDMSNFGAPLERLVNILGLEGRVIFTGSVDDRSKIALLAGCEVFAIPSIREGFGVGAVEARALRVKTVATRTGEHSAVLEDLPGNYIVRPGSVKELTEALSLALASPSIPASLDLTTLARYDMRRGCETLARSILNHHTPEPSRAT